MRMGFDSAGGQMGIPTAVRQAKLRPECAQRYPMLPARMWTSATSLTELVASYRRNGAGKTEYGRILPETDFEFRGGSPRRLGGWFAHTRTGELIYN
jgi:hypothetical protein